MNLKECWKGVDWIHLGQGRDQWRDLANRVMNCEILGSHGGEYEDGCPVGCCNL
jgi:hypothetical protein